MDPAFHNVTDNLFLRLPPELRDNIYELCFATHGPGQGLIKVCGARYPTAAPIPLAQTCKEIRVEALVYHVYGAHIVLSAESYSDIKAVQAWLETGLGQNLGCAMRISICHAHCAAHLHDRYDLRSLRVSMGCVSCRSQWMLFPGQGAAELDVSLASDLRDGRCWIERHRDAEDVYMERLSECLRNDGPEIVDEGIQLWLICLFEFYREITQAIPDFRVSSVAGINE